MDVGRRSASTREERLRVRVLAQEGFSQREIATRVFGDRRFRGRVERILKRSRTLDQDLDGETDALACLESLARELKDADIPDLDELVVLYRRRSLQKRFDLEPERVRVSELKALFELELRLANRAGYKRIRELTRH